jgi:hypothetical protein
MQISHLAIFGSLIPVFAMAANSPQTENVQIGSTRFCVPQQDVIRAAPEWIPNSSNQLKQDGVAFAVINESLSANLQYEPAPNIFGEILPISGTLTPARKDEWLSKLPVSNYWRQLAEGPNAIVEIDTQIHQIRAFQTASRDRWMVWAIDPAYPVQPASIAEGGSIVALCHRIDFRSISSRRVDETVTCDRRSVRGDFFLSYTFGGHNIQKVAALDDEVWRVVLSWRCGP